MKAQEPSEQNGADASFHVKIRFSQAIARIGQNAPRLSRGERYTHLGGIGRAFELTLSGQVAIQFDMITPSRKRVGHVKVGVVTHPSTRAIRASVAAPVCHALTERSRAAKKLRAFELIIWRL